MCVWGGIPGNIQKATLPVTGAELMHVHSTIFVYNQYAQRERWASTLGHEWGQHAQYPFSAMHTGSLDMHVLCTGLHKNFELKCTGAFRDVVNLWFLNCTPEHRKVLLQAYKELVIEKINSTEANFPYSPDPSL